MPNPEQPFLPEPLLVEISTDPGQTGRLASGGLSELLSGQKEELEPTKLEANFFGEGVLLTMRLGVDGQMHVIGSDLKTLEKIRLEDSNKQDVYLSIRIPPSKYSYFSLNVVAGRLDGTCPVMWNEKEAVSYAPLWQAKTELEIKLLEAVNKYKPEAKVKMITSQTAGKVWDTDKPSTTSVGLNIGQLVVWEEADLKQQEVMTAFEYGFEVEARLLKELGLNYAEVVEVLNQSGIPAQGTLEYILRTARPTGWQAESAADARLLTSTRLAHVNAYLETVTPWVNNSQINEVCAKARQEEKGNFAKYQIEGKPVSPEENLKPTIQPSFGEVVVLNADGKVERLVIPVLLYAMGNMERLGVNLQRNLGVESRFKDDPSPIDDFYQAVQEDLRTSYPVR